MPLLGERETMSELTVLDEIVALLAVYVSDQRRLAKRRRRDG
jgi:hypothetical protein